MSLRTLRAHYDGEQIVLDDAFDLQPNTELTITVLDNQSTDEEHEDWMRLGLSSLARAYGEDEPEYPLSLIKEANPDYDGR